MSPPALVEKKNRQGAEGGMFRAPDMTVGFDDLESAYRLIPNGQREHAVIAYWSPASQQVVFHQLWGFSFRRGWCP